jgi:hypothetical protein
MKLARTASDHPDIQELQSVATAWSDHHGNILDDWFDAAPCDDRDVGQFSFLLELLDELDLMPDREPPELAERCLAQLARFGSYRRASGRMFAAWQLMHCDHAVDHAVPALRAALRDEDYRVRVWAHCSLAILEGNVDIHRRAIEFIRAERGADARGLVGNFAESALRELEKSPARRDLDAVRGASIMNDLFTLRRLIHRVDVTGHDQDHAPPLVYAVGNSNPRVVEVLLEHGADATLVPDQRTALLHDASWRRRGEPAMVRALLEHGANPQLHDEEGRTALGVAEEFNRHENARVLRAYGAK